MMLIKCQYCGLKDTDKKEMINNPIISNEGTEKERKVNKYYHEKCFPLFLEEAEFKKKEREELDVLYNTIMDLFNTTQVPNVTFSVLASLRNGNSVSDVRSNNGEKNGYTYLEINQAFEDSTLEVKYYLANKHFKSFTQAFNYIIQIVIDKLYTNRVNKEKADDYEEIQESRTNNDYFDESAFNSSVDDEPTVTAKPTKRFVDQFLDEI